MNCLARAFRHILAHAPARDRRGIAALEFAAVAPFMLAMFFGCFEVTQLVRVSMGLGVASDAVSDYVARAAQPGGTDPFAEVTNACSGGQLMMAPFSGSLLGVAVASVTYSSSTGRVGVDWTNTSCGTGQTAIADPVSLATPLLNNPGDSVIIVQSTYAYASPVSFMLKPSYTLTHVSYSRPRPTATGS
jgi:Flp pilus assembly protein TadG